VFTRTQLETRIRSRIATAFGGDLGSIFTVAEIDALIDRMIRDALMESAEAVVRDVLYRTPEFERLMRAATELEK
jgi:hypothetical protein